MLYHLIDEYLCFAQKIINTLWNHRITNGKFVDKKWYEAIKTPLTERYKQCAAKQALQIVKSQNGRKNRTKPILRSTSLELDERFVKIELGKNHFDLWLKVSVLGHRPIMLPTKRHYHYNRFVQDGWTLKKSTRLRRTTKGLFFDVFFEKDDIPMKLAGEVVGLDLGFRKLAALSDGQLVGQNLKLLTERYYQRQNSHQITQEYINQELKQLDLTNIRILVVEELKHVKKGSKGKFSRYANRLLAHWAYRHTLTRLDRLCEENRVHLVAVNPRGTSKACGQCGSRGRRRNERFECPQCGWKVDADYNASLNIRERFLSQGAYGPLSQNSTNISGG